MKAELMLELASVPNIAGIKDSAGDWFEDQMILLRQRPPGFAVFQGNQVYAGVSLLAGADGLVPGHANIWPDLLVGMYDAALRKEVATVWAAQARLNELMTLRARAPIHTLKVIAQGLGLMGDTIATPLPRLSVDETGKCIAAHVAIGVPLAGC